MAYTTINFKFKKQVKQALKEHGSISVFQPGLGEIPENGRLSLEGPHYPEPHRWYAEGVIKDGRLVSIK